MGYLAELWDIDYDPTDASNPRGTYTSYKFTSVKHPTGVAAMSLNRDFMRRESVLAIPGMDSVLDGHGRTPGPMERRDVSFGFRVMGSDQDAAYDLLAAQVAPGVPQRLVYLTDSGAQWFTIGYNAKITHSLTAVGRGLTPHSDFIVTWRIRPWWTPRYPENATDLWGVSDGVWGTGDGNWITAVMLTAGGTNPNNFNLDATGVAGSTLPTLDDTAPVLQIQGPFGGNAGFTIVNMTAGYLDQSGTRQATQIVVPVQLGAADVCTLDMGALSFTSDGVPIRPTRGNQTQTTGSAQPWWWKVVAGVVNGCYAQSLGTGEVQRLTVGGTGLSGTFTLTFNGSTTTPLGPTASAVTVQAALVALASISTGNVTCAGGPLNTFPVDIFFSGALFPAAQPLITITNNTLAGTAPTVTLTETTLGNLSGGSLVLTWYKKRA